MSKKRPRLKSKRKAEPVAELVMGAEDMVTTSPPATSAAPPPSAPPKRHRVLRCERCRTYLFDVFLESCEPGSSASCIVTLKCRNKHCRRTNQVTIDLINEDRPKAFK